MNLAEVRAEVAVIDELLREIVRRPVDVNDPNWTAQLRQAPPPLEEAGVTAEAAAALAALLNAYEKGSSLTREDVRAIFGTYRSFSSLVHLPGDWTSAAEFRRRLVHVSAKAHGSDPRDDLVAIWSLCNQARALSIDVEPVLREVADLSDGSMRMMIMRGVEEHDLP